MKAFTGIAAALILSASSLALAEGGADRVYGKMIQANEQAMRAYAEANGKNVPEVTHYRYGMKMDVARVVSVTSVRRSCDVVPTQMTYEDSNGQLNILEYRSGGFGCPGQN
ncbi:DUF2790 domain-containing protein [Pseudomonas sp. H9]|uniref:DUF2790 domain-containing protein n=1 Tax=Pseudomonas sp. H9 TaxID=483968 RepID=UPI0010579D1B|nr:DUF2790 domain-containing protein [Pseudomonas sp. H9]TDF82383.1 DUF2790 domain-containing protein [Pseudomonas sp. H9]